MKQLSGAEFKSLREVIELAYQSRFELKRVIREELGVSLNLIAPESVSLTDTIAELIDWAEVKGQLSELLQGLQTETANPQLQALCAQLLQRESQPTSPSRELPVVSGSPDVEVLKESLPQDLECHLSIPWGLAQRGGVQPLTLSNNQRIEVNIPAGAVSGQRLRLVGAGKNNGDLHLNLDVQQQPEPELRSARGISYDILRDLLKAGLWEEADEETGYRMCEAAGRSSEGWLRTKDIDNFPCEDLRTIDQLWMHFSQGKFGFSVQAKIYLELGGKWEYNTTIWAEFCNRVGWSMNREGEWDNSSAHYAHLPFRCCFVVFRWGQSCGWRIFSRLDVCSCRLG